MSDAGDGARAKGTRRSQAAQRTGRSASVLEGPAESQVRQRAYEIHVRRAGTTDSARHDWPLAKVELQAEANHLGEGDQP
jgi:hypothetical protein